jgi:hypothetical protein
MRVHLGEGLEAQAVGQRQIEEHQPGEARGEPLQPLRQALGALDAERGVGLLRDHLANKAGIPRVVLDQEDFMHQ